MRRRSQVKATHVDAVEEATRDYYPTLIAFPRPSLTKNELRSAAHHEAGHAVIMMVLGQHTIECARVGQYIDGDGHPVLGSVKIVGPETVSLTDMTRDQLYAGALEMWAGPLAEFRAQRHRRNAELSNSYHYLTEGGGKLDYDQVHNNCCEMAARDLGLKVAYGDPWPRPVREAASLLERETERKTETLVEEHWPKIRKLAIALQQRRSMTGEEIWDLVTTPEQAEAA